MRIRIVRTFQAGAQTLNEGVLCEPADELARDWIAQGYAQAVEPTQEADPGEPAQWPESAAAPARPRRAKG